MSPNGGDSADETGDDVDRRTVLRTVGGSAVGFGLAGCVSTGTRSYEARPVRLDQEARRDGYALREEDVVETEREVEVGGDAIEATLTSHVVAYEREGEQFVEDVNVGAVSTPPADEFDVSLNPLADAPLEELVRSKVGDVFLQRLGVSADWQRDPVEVRTGTGVLLGEDVEFRTFAGITENDEFALLDVGRVEHGGDVVLAGDARLEAVESTGGALVGADGYVSAKQVDASVRTFADLLPRFVHDPDWAEGTSVRTSTGEAPEEFVALQDSVGEALVALGEANETLSKQRSELVTMIYGAIAADEIGRYGDAPLPDGIDREATLDPDPRVAERLAETEYVDHAPADENEWVRTVGRYEKLARAADDRLSAVADAVEDLRRYLERDGDSFVAAGNEPERPTMVELHPRLADEPIRLQDAPWLISQQVTALEGDHPEVYEAFEGAVDGLAEELAKTPTATETPPCGPGYSLEFVEANVSIVIGPGSDLNPFGHAWLKHSKIYQYITPDCTELSHPLYAAKVETDEWGYYLKNVKDDSGNEVLCQRVGWAGPADDPDYQDFVEELESDIEDGPGPLWSPEYNCLDWALHTLSYVDEEKADELAAEALDDDGLMVTFALIPDRLCEGG